jgi:sulfur transfer protein SufE
MERFGVPATTRASLAFYNTREDIDALVSAIKQIRHEAAARPATESKAATTVPFPEAAAPGPAAAADELAEAFDMLDDRDARSEYVLDLARKLPNTFDLLKKLTTRVPGCMSEVYLIGRRAPGNPDVFQFAADANAEIVRGEIAILQRLYSGQRAQDVLEFDIEGFFRRIGLDQFITSQRRTGLAGMVRKIQGLAQEIATPSAAKA